MKEIMKRILAKISTLFCAVMVLGCAKTSKEDHLATIVSSFGYKVIATYESKTYYPLENFDRKTYGPISFESARIKSLQPLAGYHGPTYGDYFLSIEKYGTATDAEKRVNEYRDNDRLARITGRDRNDLSKESVRCWGYSSGKTAYLLTTHSAMYSALENLTKSVITGIKTYEKSSLAK